MIWIFLACAAVIAGIIVFICTGHINENINFMMIDYFGQHKILMVYVILINAFAFAIFGIDKFQAIKSRQRVREATLFFMALIGGSIGALCGMIAFRHKIRKMYFVLGIPFMLVMNIFLLFYIMNFKW